MRLTIQNSKQEYTDSSGIRIPSGFDPDPVIALRTSVKKDESTDGLKGGKITFIASGW